MMKLRLLHVVIVSGGCLLLLKGVALMVSGGHVLTGTAAVVAAESDEGRSSTANERTAGNNAPSSDNPNKADALMNQQTDAQEKVSANQTNKKNERQGMNPETANASDKIVVAQKPQSETQDQLPAMPRNFADPNNRRSPAELGLLESLSQRRKQLEKREAEIKLKENLLKAAEKQIKARINELKTIEANISASLIKKNEQKKEQYDRLVTVYSKMKSKEAARIFNGLDTRILVDLITTMKPSSVAQIMARMDPDKAREITAALTSQTQQLPNSMPTQLPKIMDSADATPRK